MCPMPLILPPYSGYLSTQIAQMFGFEFRFRHGLLSPLAFTQGAELIFGEDATLRQRLESPLEGFKVVS